MTEKKSQSQDLFKKYERTYKAKNHHKTLETERKREESEKKNKRRWWKGRKKLEVRRHKTEEEKMCVQE